MARADDGDFIRRNREDDTVIPNAYSKVALPLACECSDVTNAGFSIFCQSAEDPNSDFAVDRPQLGACGLRPNELHRRPNSRRISSCGITFPVRTSSRA